MDDERSRAKKERLLERLAATEGLVVAFSGGVDSAFLLAAAKEALGDKALAVLAVSPIHPRREQVEAVRFAGDLGIELVQIQSDEMAIPEFVANRVDRCYHCKAALCAAFLRLAKEKRIDQVAHGANLDDLKDYRPGLRAAQQAGILSPLIDAELCKSEVRWLARNMGLPQWNKPAMACLATRFPYGSPITEDGLRMVEWAEEFLSQEGFSGMRVRHHGDVARIEVTPSEIDRLVCEPTRHAIVDCFRRIGFEHVALDLEGYASGKMNRPS